MSDYKSKEYEYDQSLELKDYIRLVRKHKLLLFLSTFVVFLATLYVTYSTIPGYKSSTLIILNEENRTQQFIGFENGFDQSSLNNEIQILTSRSLAEAVIDSLWNSPIRSNLYLFGTRVYTPKTKKLDRLLKEIITFGFHDEIQFVPPKLNKLSESKRRDYSNKLLKRLSVSLKRDTHTLEISYSSIEPNEASYILNLIIRVYQNRNLLWKNDEIVKSRDFLKVQLDDLEKDLVYAEDQKKRFQEKEKIFSSDGNTSILFEQLSEYEILYDKTIANVNEIDSLLSYEKTKLSESENTLIGDVINTVTPKIAELRSELAKQENALIQANNISVTTNSRLIQEINERINTIKIQLTEETQQLLKSGLSYDDPIVATQNLLINILKLGSDRFQLNVRAIEYKKLVDNIERELSKYPKKILTLARLNRDITVKEKLFLILKEKLKEIQLTEASQLSAIRIIDVAYPPYLPFKPNVNQNLLLGLILGLGLGIGLSLIIELLDHSIHSVDDVQQYGISVIGVIPLIGKGKRYYRRRKFKTLNQKNKNNNNNITDFEKRLITHFEPQNPVSEAYRNIRTSITHTYSDKKVKSILVTSPGAGEGKSTTVVNLAIAFAQLGKSTLLVDADLRKSLLYKVFEIQREPGITDIILQPDKFKDYKELVKQTDIENLSVITSGISTFNPSELLGSHSMQTLIKQIEKDWDIILFDSPPINAVTDSRMLSGDVDGLVLVVKAGGTDKIALKHSLSLLKSVNAPLLGCVVNGITQEHDAYGYSYYYQYYTEDKN
ncbi:MAG: polysaccharide biosynthesis tyrosine autokinase [Candidatus Marinimicrobia bacterium]|nr:polysaccharide biosynthesis tyrosine autokinase [Candidatus Neomarinimicrobiota bacterium]